MKYDTDLLANIPTGVKFCAAATILGGGILLVGKLDKKTYSIKITEGENIPLGSNWKYIPKKGLVPWDMVIEPEKPKTKIMPLGSIIPFRRKQGN